MPIIGIPLSTTAITGKDIHYLSVEYTQALENLGAFVILLPHTTDKYKIAKQVIYCDGFLIPGGDDVTPYLYGEESKPKLGNCNEIIDNYHINITREILRQNKSLLGICRGCQVLNIALGGSVYQDVSYYNNDILMHQQSGKRQDLCHYVYFQEGTKLYQYFGEKILVNSFHHQAISNLSSELIVSATASDGIIEAVESPTQKFCIGVQWHPEIMLRNNDSMNKLFSEFLISCLN